MKLLTVALVGLTAIAAVPQQTATGTIVGTVTTTEPAPKPIRSTIDQSVCGDAVPDESLVVSSGHVANVVVTVTNVPAGDASPADTLVANDKCRFVPRVSTLRPGGTLRMTSRDPMLHTMRAVGADGHRYFDLSLPVPNAVVTRPLQAAGLVTLTCSTHTWMRGYVNVSTELSAISGGDGTFRLDHVPAGGQQLRIWHETLKALPVAVTVVAGKTATVNVVLAK